MAHYDRIGGGYDATRRADPHIAGRLRELLRLPAGGRCLDVGCGTGNYTLALAAGLRMVGMDVSRRMLEVARAKQGAACLVQGDAVTLPFRAGAFKGAICTLAVHHFAAMGPAFAEVARVLGAGRFVLFTDDPEQMRGYWLNEYFPEMMARSIRQMPPVESVIAALRAAGFGEVTVEPYEVAPTLRDLFLYSGKQRPGLYLDPRVRAGISSFAVLADPTEVQQGCERLAADVASGRFAEVAASYRHDRGDYLFVVAQRR